MKRGIAAPSSGGPQVSLRLPLRSQESSCRDSLPLPPPSALQPLDQRVPLGVHPNPRSGVPAAMGSCNPVRLATSLFIQSISNGYAPIGSLEKDAGDIEAADERRPSRESPLSSSFRFHRGTASLVAISLAAISAVILG